MLAMKSGDRQRGDEAPPKAALEEFSAEEVEDILVSLIGEEEDQSIAEAEHAWDDPVAAREAMKMDFCDFDDMDQKSVAQKSCARRPASAGGRLGGKERLSAGSVRHGPRAAKDRVLVSRSERMMMDLKEVMVEHRYRKVIHGAADFTLKDLSVLLEHGDHQRARGYVLESLKYFTRALLLQVQFYGENGTEVAQAAFQIAHLSNILAHSALARGRMRMAGAALKNADYLLTWLRNKRKGGMKLLKRTDFWAVLATTCALQAQSLSREGKVKSAVHKLEEGLELERRLGVVENIVDTLLKMCTMLSQLGRHTEALNFALDAHTLQEKDGYWSGANADEVNSDRLELLCVTYHNIGVECNALERYSSSLNALREGFTLAQNHLGASHLVTDALRSSLNAASLADKLRKQKSRCGEAGSALVLMGYHGGSATAGTPGRSSSRSPGRRGPSMTGSSVLEELSANVKSPARRRPRSADPLRHSRGSDAGGEPCAVCGEGLVFNRIEVGSKVVCSPGCQAVGNIFLRKHMLDCDPDSLRSTHVYKSAKALGVVGRPQVYFDVSNDDFKKYIDLLSPRIEPPLNMPDPVE